MQLGKYETHNTTVVRASIVGGATFTQDINNIFISS